MIDGALALGTWQGLYLCDWGRAGEEDDARGDEPRAREVVATLLSVGDVKATLAALTPMLARPGDPGNGVAVRDLEAPVHVDIAYGGSCTGGKRADFDAYHEVIKWALDHGRPLAAQTKMYLQFGTLDTREYCVSRGYLDTFEKAGVTLIMPGCGACANCGPGSSTSAEQVTVSAINRNFPGRSGPGNVYLASPYTVAASAVAGRIATFDDIQASTG